MVDAAGQGSGNGGPGGEAPIAQHDPQVPRLDVAIEHDSYVAGQINIVRLLISNPYDQTVEIAQIETPQSSSFTKYQSDDVQQRADKDQSAFARWTRSFLAAFSAISVAGVTIELPRSTRDLSIHAGDKSTIKFGRSLNEFGRVSIHADEEAQVEISQDAEAERPSARPITLRPRSTIVYPVSVVTRQWLLFTPQRFGLNVEITFSLRDVTRSQVVNAQMDIRPPLASMICGAVLGGALGSVVASLNKGNVDMGSAFLHCLTAVLMSGIAAVSLSRRGNTQAFVTVEDFFGAFFVGSLIGYGGVAYFERAVLPQTHDAR